MTLRTTRTDRKHLAARMTDVQVSGIREVYEAVTRWADRTGGRLIPFHFGMPDFDTPIHVKHAAIRALEAGFVQYTSSAGIPELRQAVARKLVRDNGIPLDPASEIIITCGANEALSTSILALIDPGDEVILTDPSWSHYDYMLHLAGATIVRCPLRESEGFVMDPDTVAKAWTPRTRMLILNSPHNPTGAVTSPDSIAAIARFVHERGGWLLSDEAYESLVFDGSHFSPASIPELRDSVLTVGCLSKTYAMTGWRIGYICGPAHVMEAINRIHLYTVSCANSFAQKGAVAALDGPRQAVDEMRESYRRRRDLMVALLREIPGLQIRPPAGAFYAFPNISAFGLPSKTIALRLVEEGVGAVHGSAFGPGGEGYLRLSFACSEDDIREGIGRMRRVLVKVRG
jgi:aspartate/methionine/tyrosine aminotransferase